MIYKVGDRVRIKDEIYYFDSDHPAWKHAGTVMTVRKVVTRLDGGLLGYLMEEDQEECGGWPWYDCDIDGYAEDFEDTFDDSAFPEITFEQLLAATLTERRTS